MHAISPGFRSALGTLPSLAFVRAVRRMRCLALLLILVFVSCGHFRPSETQSSKFTGSKSKESKAFFDAYRGQTVQQLIALTNKYRVDSLVLAIDQALQAKPEQKLSEVERIVLAVEALEREVNNGGYELFFENSSRQYRNEIVNALEVISCSKAAAITAEAVEAVATAAKAEESSSSFSEEIKRQLRKCDERFFKNDEAIADALFAFIEKNQQEIRIPK